MIECPDEVVEAGMALIVARKTAWKLLQDIAKAQDALGPAVTVMVQKHGAKVMQSGTAWADLCAAASAYGLIMKAHDSLRLVLDECDVAQPTDEQIVAAAKTAGVEIASIR